MLSNNSEFCLTPVTDFVFSTGTNGTVMLRVNLPEKSELERLVSTDAMLPYRRQDCLLWVSGGGCYVLNDEWVPLLRRSEDSPSNSGKITICSGRADSASELYEPSRVFRELFEEIVILAADGRLMIPDFGEVTEPSALFWSRQLLVDLLVPLVRLNGIQSEGIMQIPATLDSKVSVDQVEVCCTSQLVSKTACLVHHQPENGEINLLCAVRLDLGEHDLELLRFFDTECAVVSGVETPLRREIYMYHIPTRQFFLYQPGWSHRATPTKVRMTEHAAHLLDRICQTYGNM
jgi:hypothetical protein